MNFSPFCRWYSLALIVSMIYGLYSCNRPDCTYDNCLCTEEYAPVCGADGQEYSNACFAECAGVTWTKGLCPSWADALVLYMGDPAADGCGWVVEVNDTAFSPILLESRFKVDSLPVSIKYRNTHKRADVCWGALYRIDILFIKRR